MGISNLFKKREALIGLDIGSSVIKLVELTPSAEGYTLANIGVAPTPPDCIQANIISKTEAVAEVITALLEENSVSDRRVSLAMPGTSAFTKRVTMSRMPWEDLAENVQLEAGNFIPKNVNAVKLDFHVLREVAKDKIDVLVVAVKEEVVDSYVEALAIAGLEAAVVDVDYFAVQNTFELGYPDLIDKTIGLINFGHRFASINICRGGASYFTGDVALGGKLLTDALTERLSLSLDEAERFKRNPAGSGERRDDVSEVIEKNVEYLASEFNRQLSFFWGASGADDAIDRIMVTGGSSGTPGLLEELSEKTGIKCEILDPMKGIEVPSGFDKGYIRELAPAMAVAIGLGIREAGDKIIPEFME